ncbi:MAG TPA: hypothetical protein VFU19_13825 [Iamia sp.]|nr:hypothetical protein [Iamia sp.]
MTAGEPPKAPDGQRAEGDGPEDDESGPGPDPSAPASFPLDDSPSWAATDGGTTRALSQFLTISPCLDLYQRSGSSHRVLFGVCFALDLVIRLGATVLILAILAAVAWKTLAPLPVLWDR